MNFEQMFTNLKNQYIETSSITRKINLILPKNKKRVNSKNSYVKAIKTFNLLPNSLKTLDMAKQSNNGTKKLDKIEYET